jgi:hypothetical protein
MRLKRLRFESLSIESLLSQCSRPILQTTGHFGNDVSTPKQDAHRRESFQFKPSIRDRASHVTLDGDILHRSMAYRFGSSPSQ